MLNGDDEDFDKSIVNVKLTESTDTSVKIKIDFGDVDAISRDINEPDEVSVKFVMPELFVDAETGESLSDMSWEKTFKIGPQYTES